MAEKEDNGPSPLEDPNSVDYDCSICHNMYTPHTDSDGTDYVCEICDTNKEKNLCHACMETISDSSRSSDTNLDFVQNFDESGFLVKHLTMKLEQCQSITFEKRVERDSDTESDYTDMPPLEETKKTNFDTDEDSDELPPLEP